MPLLIFMILLRGTVYTWLLLFTAGLLLEETEKWHARIKRLRAKRRICIVIPFPGRDS